MSDLPTTSKPPAKTPGKLEKLERRLKKKLRYKSDDAVMPDPKDTDIIIPIMGPTGAGKSTFINTAMRSDAVVVGHDLNSCTARLQHVFLPPETVEHRPELKNRRIVLLDTPGFDDTYVDDVEVLRRIAIWLSLSYNKGMKLAGIIYLHDISQTRVFGSTRKNLEMFRVLCGDAATKRVVLTTSKWTRVEAPEGKRRVEQLEKDFWGGLMALGAKSHRFEGTQQSAMEIIHIILQSVGDHLEIQREIVDLERLLPQTDVGRTLSKVLKDTVARQKVLNEKMKQWDTETADPKLRKEYEDNRKRLEATLKQIDELKIPISTRILSFLGFT